MTKTETRLRARMCCVAAAVSLGLIAGCAKKDDSSVAKSSTTVELAAQSEEASAGGVAARSAGATASTTRFVSEMNLPCLDKDKNVVWMEFGRVQNPMGLSDRWLRLEGGAAYFYGFDRAQAPEAVVGVSSVYVSSSSTSKEAIAIAFFDPARGATLKPTDLYWERVDTSVSGAPRVTQVGVCFESEEHSAKMARYAHSVARTTPPSQARSAAAAYQATDVAGAARAASDAADAAAAAADAAAAPYDWGTPVTEEPVRASFDCARASTAAERMVCADQELGDRDIEMARAFRAALQSSSDQAALRKSQRTWIREVQSRCDSRECLLSAYEARTAELL
jgi:uncharacterized protein YecT (DUF1311 family)